MTALAKQIDDTYSPREFPLGGSVASYLRELVLRDGGIKELDTGAGRIFLDLYPLLPTIEGFESQRKDLCSLITECIYPYAQSLLAGGVHIKLTISNNREDLAPPTVVGEGETFAAFGTDGVMHCVFLPPYHALTDAAAIAIPAGLAVECRPVRKGEHRLQDYRGTWPGGTTSNFPNRVPENRFKDPIRGYEDEWPPRHASSEEKHPHHDDHAHEPHADQDNAEAHRSHTEPHPAEHPNLAHAETPHVAHTQFHSPDMHAAPHPSEPHGPALHPAHAPHAEAHGPEAHPATHIGEPHIAHRPHTETHGPASHREHPILHAEGPHLAQEPHTAPHGPELHAVQHPVAHFHETHIAHEPHLAHEPGLHAEPHPAAAHTEHVHAEAPHPAHEVHVEAHPAPHGPEAHAEPHPAEAHDEESHPAHEPHAENHEAESHPEPHAESHGPEAHAGEPHPTHESHIEEPHPVHEARAETRGPEIHAEHAAPEPHTETAEAKHEPAHIETEVHPVHAPEMEQRRIKLAERDEFAPHVSTISLHPAHEAPVVPVSYKAEHLHPAAQVADLRETLHSPAYEHLLNEVPAAHHHVYDSLQPPQETPRLHAAPEVKPAAAPKVEPVIKLAAMPMPKPQRLTRAAFMKRLYNFDITVSAEEEV